MTYKIINDNNENLSIINKKKNFENTYDLDEFDIRVRLSKEESVKKKDTDILSFPNEKPNFYRKKLKQKNIYLGDLALSFNYIKKQKIEFEEYLKKTLIHGFLHLIGYDHNNNKNYLKVHLFLTKYK